MRIHSPRTAFRRRKQVVAQCLKEQLRIYCDNTTLHGFRYVTIRDTHIIESVLWFLVCILSVIFCFVLMMRLWNHFDENPTATAISTTNPIWSIYFPGVTICNNNKVYMPHAKYFANILFKHGINYSQSDKLFVSLMKLTRPDQIEVDNLTATRALEILGFTVDRFMYELMQPCKAMLLRCAWLGKQFNCSDIFKAVKSREGYCCAFNYHFNLDRQYGYDNYEIRNVSEEGDHSDITSDKLPGIGDIQKAPGSGRDVGLAVALNIEGEHYKSSNRPYVGATVLIHDPNDYPDIGIHSISVLPGHVMGIGVSGMATESAQDVRQLPLNRRMCLFEDEMITNDTTATLCAVYILTVKGGNNYSFQSCVSDCMHMRVHKYCGCLPFYYPNENSKTCYLTDIECILNHRRRFSTYGTSFTNECDCLPQCSDTFYDIVPESIPIEDVGYDSEMTRDVDDKNASFLYVYFRDVSYIEYRKQNIISWDSLLASFGGIFGLCLGGSVISLVEFFYFLAREFFYLLKGSTSRRRNFPAASKLFLSVPLRASSKWRKFNDKRRTNENDDEEAESPVYIVSNRILLRRREERFNGNNNNNNNNDNNNFRTRNSTIRWYND